MAKLTNEQKQKIVLACKQDITFFAKHICGSELSPKQIEFAIKWLVSLRTTFKGGVGFGKTHIMAILILWALFTHNDVQVTIFGPGESQIKDGIWKEIGIIWGRMDPEWKDLFDYQATRLSRKDSPTGAFAAYRLANKDNIESARGIHMRNNFVFVDEASGVPDEIFQVLGNIFTDQNPKLCLISNPARTTGFFYDTWEHEDISTIWTKVHGKMSDNPRLAKEAYEAMAIGYGGKGSRDYRINVEGEFPLDEVDGVIPAHLVREAIENTLAVAPFDAAVIWGLDPNGGGKDRSVLVKRQDNVVTGVKEFPNLNAVQLAQAVFDEYHATPKGQRPVDICVDANGPGYGVYVMLMNMGLPVKKVMAQNSPTRDPQLYSRMRDQLWWAGRKWFEEGGVSIPNHPDLIAELCLPTYEYETTGKIKVEDKKSIRKRGRRSPDFADAFCLTFASTKSSATAYAAWSKPIEYDVRHYE
ncbi:terminase large subunit domain-containing protein